jgi:hypothetical protein
METVSGTKVLSSVSRPLLAERNPNAEVGVAFNSARPTSAASASIFLSSLSLKAPFPSSYFESYRYPHIV